MESEQLADGCIPTPIRGSRKVQLGLATYLVPPLLLRDAVAAFTDGTFDLAAQAAGDPRAMTPAKAAQSFQAMLRLGYLSLKRNYPALTVEQVEELIDMGNLPEMQQAMYALNRVEMRPTPAAGTEPRPNGHDPTLIPDAPNSGAASNTP